MTLYRKKPVVVEAVQWPKNYSQKESLDIAEWCGGACMDLSNRFIALIAIKTLEDTDYSYHYASPGDYIIKGIKGEFYPCRPDIFEATYELVTPTDEEFIKKNPISYECDKGCDSDHVGNIYHTKTCKNNPNNIEKLNPRPAPPSEPTPIKNIIVGAGTLPSGLAFNFAVGDNVVIVGDVMPMKPDKLSPASMKLTWKDVLFLSELVGRTYHER